MMLWRTTLTAILLSSICFCGLTRAPAAHADDTLEEKGLVNPFFIMDTIFGVPGSRDLSAKEQVAIAKELGYAGISYWGNVEGLSELLAELDKAGLAAYPPYYGVNLDPGKQKYDPQLKEAIGLLKGRDAAIWIFITSREYERSSPEGDPRAVEILREIADMAQEAGVRIALYPHTGFWIERIEDAVRVAKKVDRENVGVTFNLCHWLRVDGTNMKARLELALPHLFMVTINGADPEGTDWDRLIQPLDRGTFDMYGFLKTLKELGYTGPMGLQGYGVKGDPYENLKRSMEAWRALCDRIAATE
jgi:sugar phosphate isomerase/epimerase